MREAEVREGGVRLGEAGGRIIGEVVLGLLELDPTSYYSVDRGWKPTVPGTGDDGRLTVADLITHAQA